MTNPTNWPNPERPGLPMFPERDGWHSLHTYSRGLFFWDSANKYWWDSQKRFYRTVPEILKDAVGTKYIGPILTSTQIAEFLAGERERCAKLLEDAYEKTGKDFEYLGCLSCADEIRNLGAAP